jgi:hypothetical protein
MNCTRHDLRHCDREQMHKCDTSTLTSGPDLPAGPTRTAAIQKIHHCHQSAGISKTITLSASQIVAPLFKFLHYIWCACRHSSSIGQVHCFPSCSDGTRVVRVANLLNPLCARLHPQGRGPARQLLLHADVPQDGTLKGDLLPAQHRELTVTDLRLQCGRWMVAWLTC